MANEQLPSSNSPTLVSEPNSAVQTESESSDGGSSSSDDTDDDKPSEQSPSESDQSADEQEQRSDANDDEVDDGSDDTDTDDDVSTKIDDDDKKMASKGDDNDVKEKSFVATIDDGDKIDIDTSSAPQQTVEQATDAAAAAAKVEDDLDDDIRYKNLKIIHDGRDILDFSANVANKSWNVQYAYLPDKDPSFYFNNRSLYNRLSVGYQDNPNHDYVLAKCGLSCTFQYPVVISEKNDQMPTTMVNENGSLGELLGRTTAASCRLLPMQNTNVPAERISPAAFANGAATAPSSAALELALLQTANNFNSMNLNASNNNNNFMMRNRSQMMPSSSYQNGKPILKNADAFATAAAAVAAAAANNNSHSCYKQNNMQGGTNAFYNRNTVNAATLNSLINQLGGNAMNVNNIESYLNGHSYGGHNNHGHSHNHQNNNSANQQLSLAALATLMNRQQQQQQQQHQHQQQQQQQQWYGMCPHNINKSGINFNANSHKSMPTYSNF